MSTTRLTRHGVVALVIGVAALVIGRVFGVVELYVIGAAFLIAPLVALLAVHLRRPRLRAGRWIHPALLTAGESGRVDVALTNTTSVRSAPFDVTEAVEQPPGPPRAVRLSLPPLAAGATTSARYSLPTAVRGVVQLGPLVVETTDLLGLARWRGVAAGRGELTVVPRTHLLDLPTAGRGPLGRALADLARRLGPGEFHSLRDYVDGDEPRSIHWRASARSDSLKVQQRTTEGLNRCTVYLDVDPASYLDRDGFERAITAAASIVHSAAHGGLTTRLLCTNGLDLRGPDVGATSLRHLAVIEPTAPGAFRPERDPSEGIGMLVVVTGSTAAGIWRRAEGIVDPTVAMVRVLTDGAAPNRLGVGARTERDFLDGWRRLTGRRPVGVSPDGSPEDLTATPGGRTMAGSR